MKLLSLLFMICCATQAGIMFSLHPILIIPGFILCFLGGWYGIDLNEILEDYR